VEDGEVGVERVFLMPFTRRIMKYRASLEKAKGQTAAAKARNGASV